VLPRGFAAQLKAGLAAAGIEVTWDNQTVAPALTLSEQLALPPIALRDDQLVPCADMLTHRQGVLQGNTGFGKTVVCLEAWRRTGLSGLVLVDKLGLAEQWRERAREFLGSTSA
jgi:superfamily II DNA or RNA helicase